MAQSSQSSSSFTTSLKEASHSWSSFAIESKKSTLSNSVTQTKTNHQQSLKTRKTLADATKSFKKIVKQTESILSKHVTTSSTSSSSSDKNIYDKFSTDVKTIVKMYQEEIDVLTKRCKSSDNTLLDLYKHMIELPDPSPFLSNAVNHIHSLEEQIQHLLKGMEEMQTEVVVKQQSKIQSLTNELEQSNLQNTQTQKEIDRYQTQIQSLENENHGLKENANQTFNTMSQTKEEKEELITLRREVAEYEVEFKTLKNQDITIKKLNAKIEELITNQEDELQRELKYVFFLFLVCVLYSLNIYISFFNFHVQLPLS